MLAGARPGSAPAPLAVISGFLGSGKTTFLRRVLADAAMADTAVVVNEFGAVGLDHLLLEAAPDQLVALPNGCLCCAVRQDLVVTLRGLLRRRAEGLAPFRRIVVETSGLAEPAPILATLAADPVLERAFCFAGLTVIVDAVHGEATLRQHAEATAQAALADVLLFSKTDLAEPPPALPARLAALNPGAVPVPTAQVADPAALLFAARRPGAWPKPRSGFAAVAAHGHGISGLAIELRRPVTRLEFARALGGLAQARGEDLLRMKGLVGFADRQGGPAAIHAVQHTLYPPHWLDAWPDEDRRSRLVLILRGIAPELVFESFAAGDPALLAPTKPAAPEPGPGALAVT